MRALVILFVAVLAGHLGAAVKPDHILQDPQARVFQAIVDEKLQTRFGAQMALYMQAMRPANAVNGNGMLRIRPHTRCPCPRVLTLPPAPMG